MKKRIILAMALCSVGLITSACSSSNEEAVTTPVAYQELSDPDVLNLLWGMSPQEVMLQEEQNQIVALNGVYSAEKIEFAGKEWKATYEFNDEGKLNNIKCEYIGEDSQKAFDDMTEYFLHRYGLGLMTEKQAAWRGKKYDIFMELFSDKLTLNLGYPGLYYSYFSEYESPWGYPVEYKDVFYCYKDAVGTMTLDKALEIAPYSGIYAMLTSSEDNSRNLITIANEDSEYAVNVYTSSKDGKQMVNRVQLKHEVSIWNYALEISNSSHQGDLTYSVIDYEHGSKRMSYDTLDEAATSFFDYQNNYRKNNLMEGTTSTNSLAPSLTVEHGEVLDVNVTGNTLIVKAKITPSYSNSATISQNFFNIEDLIKNQGCSKYEEIQYWAVADMTDGSESKVIAFTVPKSTIDGINDGSIGEIAYLDEYNYIDDVYILPSLLD